MHYSVFFKLHSFRYNHAGEGIGDGKGDVSDEESDDDGGGDIEASLLLLLLFFCVVSCTSFRLNFLLPTITVNVKRKGDMRIITYILFINF